MMPWFQSPIHGSQAHHPKFRCHVVCPFQSPIHGSQAWHFSHLFAPHTLVSIPYTRVTSFLTLCSKKSHTSFQSPIHGSQAAWRPDMIICDEICFKSPIHGSQARHSGCILHPPDGGFNPLYTGHKRLCYEVYHRPIRVSIPYTRVTSHGVNRLV